MAEVTGIVDAVSCQVMILLAFEDFVSYRCHVGECVP